VKDAPGGPWRFPQAAVSSRRGSQKAAQTYAWANGASLETFAQNAVAVMPSSANVRRQRLAAAAVTGGWARWLDAQLQLVVAVTAGVLPRALHAQELEADTPRADRKPGTRRHRHPEAAAAVAGWWGARLRAGSRRHSGCASACPARRGTRGRHVQGRP
jgi:hypothetical protein